MQGISVQMDRHANTYIYNIFILTFSLNKTIFDRLPTSTFCFFKMHICHVGCDMIAIDRVQYKLYIYVHTHTEEKKWDCSLPESVKTYVST